MRRDPFQLHRNKNFEKLVDTLISHGIIKLNGEECDGNSKKSIPKEEDVIKDLLLISYLLHSNFLIRDTGLIIDGENIQFNLTFKSKALDVINKLVPPDNARTEIKDELINSFLAIIVSSIMCFKAIYPNTYIVELGRNTHEFDIFGIGLFDNKKIYMIMETTTGWFSIDREYKQLSHRGDTHTWHFKKAVMKKWAIEKIFSIDTFLFYLSLIPIYEDEFIEKILENDKRIKILNFPVISTKEGNKPLIDLNTNFSQITDRIAKPIISLIEELSAH